MKKVTIKDVARKAGVSTSLVSRVLNAPLNSRGEPECDAARNTALRILRVVHELGYRPNKAAASLRKSQARRIGVVLPDISHPYFSEMARNFEKLAENDGYIVIFGSTNDQADKMGRILDAFLQDNVDGLIIVPGLDCDSRISAVIREEIPTVIVARDLPELQGVGRVVTDNVKATELAVNHLLECGYTSIEMLSSTHRLVNIIEREKLFEEYMAGLGMQTRIHLQDVANPQASTYYILQDILRRGVQALYCPSAAQPLACMKVCCANGIRIPEDIALLGYDGGEMYTLTSPCITCVDFSREEMARNAYRILISRINDHSIPPANVVLPPKLIAAGSTLGNRFTANTVNSAGGVSSTVSPSIKDDISARLDELRVLIGRL